MAYLNQKPIRINPAGEAKAREQRRQAELETEQRNKTLPAFMFLGYGFRPQYNDRVQLHIEGPLCPKLDSNGEYCFSELTGKIEKDNVKCDVCGFTGTLPYTHQRFREIAHKKYEGHKRYIESGGIIETLDVPYDAIKKHDKDETREIQIKWAQKDGRNTAMIWFINRGQHEGKKAHLIVDLDREELRHDATDERPGTIISKVTAEFPDTRSEITYSDQEHNKIPSTPLPTK